MTFELDWTRLDSLAVPSLHCPQPPSPLTMWSTTPILATCLLALHMALVPIVNAAAPSDSPRDADIGQSGYVGGAHNMDPESIPQFKQLWNATFLPDEKVRLPPPPNSHSPLSPQSVPPLSSTPPSNPPTPAPRPPPPPHPAIHLAANPLHSLHRKPHPHLRRRDRRATRGTRDPACVADGASVLRGGGGDAGDCGDAGCVCRV